MLRMIRPAAVLLVLLTFLTGVLYPLAITGVAQWWFPWQARGSVQVVDGRPVGSVLLGQEFRDAGHFWGRLSATQPVPYAAQASAGSNRGPLARERLRAAEARLAAWRRAGECPARVPLELLTASGSGLDPDLSLEGALAQSARVAASSGLAPARVDSLVRAHTRVFGRGVLGAPRVNVLELNLALDRLRVGRAPS